MAGEGTKRIIDLTEAAETQSGDYIAIDSTGRGTRKLPAGFMATAEDLSEEETARQTADATLDGKITAEAQARLDADNALGDQITALDEKTEADAALIQNPTKTLSGALCSFTDGADMPMVACTAEIVPKQSGSGTPSPDNVRQISGWESVNVNVAGVNVWDEEWRLGYYNGSNGEYVYNSSQICNTNPISVKPSTAYYLKTPSNLRVVFYRNDMSFIRATITGSGVFNTPDDCCFVGFNTFQNPPYPSGSTYGHDISINYPSTDHEYHAYNGTTTTTALGRTVYGGTLDVVSGVLTAYPFYPSYNGETLNGRWICDRAVYAEGTTPPTGSQVALISGTGTTYQLTPTQISTLLGENNVWADAGAVEVTYRKDINIVIDELTNAIVSLGSNV